METSSNPKRFSGIVDIPFVDKSNEATICENCQKPLDENAIVFTNGKGFCCKECEVAYDNKVLYGAKITDAINDFIPPLYRKTDLNLIKNNLKHPEYIDRILQWTPNPKGLAIIGSTGAGKTRAITCLLKKLISIDLVGITSSLKVFYAGELERAIINSFKKTSEYDVLMRQLENCGLLIIDDLGKEKFTERYEISIFQIFEKRFANLKPIIFTTNYRGEEFKARFSDMANYEPFSRRVNEFMQRINLVKKN